MTLRLGRALTIGLLGTGLCLAPLSTAAPESGPAMDEERMTRMMKMMSDMQSQMREMQGQMQGMGGMHGQMGRMMGQMGQMRGMMEQHQQQMMRHCPAGAATPSVPSK
jgi:hypothetical protein